MPSLVSYRKVAPFGIDELVESANSIVRARPRLQTTVRTVRFYASKGLLPRPSGAPKVARYGMEHLGRLVAIRCLQDRGVSLEDIGEELDRRFAGSEDDAIRWVQEMVDGRSESPQFANRIVPSTEPVLLHSTIARQIPPDDEVVVRRIVLAQGMVLEVSGLRSTREALQEAQKKIAEKLNDST